VTKRFAPILSSSTSVCSGLISSAFFVIQARPELQGQGSFRRATSWQIEKSPIQAAGLG
jgi:hypothetical protein